MYIPHHPKLKTQFLCPGLIAPRAVAFFLGPRRSGDVDWKPNLAAAKKLHKSLYVKDLHTTATGKCGANPAVAIGRVSEETSAVRTLRTPTCEPALGGLGDGGLVGCDRWVMPTRDLPLTVPDRELCHGSGIVFPHRESISHRRTRVRLALLAARIALFYLPRAS